MTAQSTVHPIDLHATVTTRRLVGVWRLMKGFRLTYLAATLSIGLAATGKTATYLLLKYLIDSVLTPNRLDLLPQVALGFIGLALFEGFFTFASGNLAARTAEGIARRLRNYLFDHIQRLSFSYHSQTPTGDLIQRATSDVDALRRFFSEQAINFGRITLMFTINFIALLQLNVRLTLLSVVVVPFIILLSLFFFRKITAAYEKYQEQEAVLSTTLQENLTGVRVVKAFARQNYERAKFEKENLEKYQRGKRLLLMHSLFWPFSDILIGLQMIVGFTLGALATINGELTLGGYLAYASLVVWVIWPMRNLGRLIVQMSTGLVSYNRVAEILKQEPEPGEETKIGNGTQLRGELVFDHVGFAYEDDNIPVLKNVTFTAKPGQVIALLGSTGSGKTTLVNLLPRFHDYTSGSIRLDGRELRDYSRHYLRRQIGIVEQEPFLFSRSIRDNITYGVEHAVSEAEVEQAARSAAIHDSIMTFPEGYQTMVGEKGVTLSGGQKQRIAIARTLLKNPKILILDDSTSAVDMETEAAIREALERLMQNRTTFIIAHRIQSIMSADWILVFDRGEIVQQGTHETLVGQPGTYRNIFDIQTRIEDELEEEMNRVAR